MTAGLTAIEGAIREALGKQIGAVQEFDFEQEVRSGDTTIARWVAHVAHDETFMGMEATYQRVRIPGASFVTQGSLREPVFRHYVDWAYVLGQLGVVFTMQPTVTELVGLPSFS